MGAGSSPALGTNPSKRAVSSAGRASRLHRGGRGFEPLTAHMTKYIVGIIIIAIGILMTVKTEWFLRAFGRIAWAEEKLGTEGGTRIFFKIVGIGAVIVALLIMTGHIQVWITDLFVR